ncbi:MAG: SusC/RagA family TonB-linked outer membrane protein [Flavobacteriaceae bacterium]
MENFLTNFYLSIKKVTFLVALLFLGLQVASGQESSVTGVVSDNHGQPIPGASVVIQGTTVGTATDFDGNYSIKASSDDVLVFSYLGSLSKEIPVDNQSIINVALQENIAQLDEVVVVGYGTLKQKEVTSAIVSVKEGSFNKGNLNSPEQLLAGKVAGLTVSKQGGSPTSRSTIRLRGLATFGANTEPLIVIDGMIGGSLSNVDPNDIASIDVLKDASAGAIYGTRGSSGVIIITTKSGSTQQKAQLDVGIYTVFEDISNLPGRISVADFRAAENSVDFGSDTDWIDEVTRTAVTNVYNVAFSNNLGGTSYRASINLRDVEGVIKNQDITTLNTRLNISQKLFDDRLTLTAIMSFSRTNANLENEGVLRQALLWNPTGPVFENRTEAELGRDPNRFGGFFESQLQGIFNPVAMIELNTRERKDKRILANFKADYELVKNLTISANYSYQVNSRLEGFYSDSGSITGAGRGLGVGEQVGGRAERFTSNESDQLFEFTSKYSNSVGDLSYSILGGYGYQEQLYEEFWLSNTNFITDDVLFNNIGLGLGLSNPGGAVASVGSNKTESLLTSYFGRANFSYKETYNLATSFRREASSRFGANNRWGNFWALSGSVNLDNIFDFNNVEILKLRVGYGVTGNTPVQRYAFLETLGADPNNLGYVNGEFIPAVEPTSNPNPDLKWEEKGEFNVGLDFSIFENKVYGSFDYYNRSTIDLLNEIDVPSPPNLFPRALVNLGELETKGYEAQVTIALLDKQDFTWDFGLIFDTNETKLVKFNNLASSEILIENLGVPGLNNLLSTRVKEGDPIGNILAPQFSRFNEDNRALVFAADGTEILASEASADDFVVAGNGLPDFSLSFTNTFTYKKFDLNFLFRGIFGHSLANLPNAMLGHSFRANQHRHIIGDFFNPDGADDSAWHTEYVEDASFLRLDNLTLGYNLDVKQLGAISKLRIYASGNNLLTITKYSGADPEPRFVGRSGILAPGYDRLEDYFPTRSFSLGVNITF